MFHRHDRIGSELHPVERFEERVVILVVVGRIGEDDVELLVEAGQDRDDVALNRRDRDIPLFRESRDRLGRAAIVVDGCGRYGAARIGLKGKNPAAREEIEESRALDAIADDVEKRLSRTLGSRTEVAGWNGNTAAAERAGGHTQGCHYCCAAPVVPMK